MARCPVCKKAIPWWSIRSAFSCPHCGRALGAKTTGPVSAAIAIWILMDVPAYRIAHSFSGNDSFLPYIAYPLLSAVVGIGLLSVAMGHYSRVFVRSAGSRGSKDKKRSAKKRGLN